MAQRERRAMVLAATAFWIWTSSAGRIQGAPNPLATARSQFERGDYRAAIATLSSAIDANAGDAELWHWRSRCYLELRDYSHALADGERAVTERLGDSEFHRWLGHAYGGVAEQKRSLSMARKVRAAFEDAVRLDSSNIAARRDLMEFYVEAPWIVGGDKRKALEQVDAITRIDAVSGHLARALFWIRTNRLDAADAEYQQILEARPDRIEPYLEAADFDESRSDAGRLASVVEQSARVAPSDMRLTYYRGVALVLANGNLTEAERVLRVYLATAPRRSDWPSHAVAHTWLGRLHEHRGELSAALDEYQSALVLDPESKHAREAVRRLKHVAP
jgi:tetratricopeptide (TPR) repeat protein